MKASKLLSWPLRLYECCPMSEGACAGRGHVGAATASSRPGCAASRRCTDTYAMGDRMHRPEGSLVDLVTLQRGS